MKQLDLGIFLPNAKNGFVFSDRGTPYRPSFAENLAIAQLAEAAGFDYLFSMAKWRGFGGSTGLWDSSLEAFSLMLALGMRTQTIGLIATVNPLHFHPAVMAKMAATFEECCGGRLGLNIITGGIIGEYSQMGIVPDGYEENRYAYAAEWVRVLKRLWAEGSVTHEGQFFQLADCVSMPKPAQRPAPRLICAASSDEGLRFTAREADWCFITGRDVASVRDKAAQARAVAAEEGRSLKIALLVMLIIGDDDADARRRVEDYISGADFVALRNMGLAQTQQARAATVAHGEKRLSDTRQVFFGLPVIGGPATVADALGALASEVDSVALMFPDFEDGLARFGAEVLPTLRCAA